MDHFRPMVRRGGAEMHSMRKMSHMSFKALIDFQVEP